MFGALEIHGIPRSVYWTQLTQTVTPGDDTLTVAAETDWVIGDEIVVATTSYEAWQTETFQIAEVLSASSFRLNGTFAYKHIGEWPITNALTSTWWSIKPFVRYL